MRRALAVVVLATAACAPQTTPTTTTTIAPAGPARQTTSTTLPAVDAEAGVGDRMFPELGNAGYDVRSYAIDLTFDDRLQTVIGSVEIDAVASVPLRSFVLDFVGHEVTELTVDGERAEVARGPRDMRVTPARRVEAGSRFVVVVDYVGVVAPVSLTEAPFPAGWQRSDDGGVFLFSQPDGASGAFPANDHPTDRADVTLSVSVPEPWVAVSGGSSRPVLRDGDTTVYRFHLPEVAPYLVPLVVGVLERVSAGDAFTWLPAGSDLPEGFDRQGEILAVLEADLGEYPFDVSGAVIADSRFPAALETQTLSTYTHTSAAWGEEVIAHELAHQWFGNEITLGQWDDIWLNEGFATFMTWRYLERVRGRETYDTEVRNAWAVMASSDVPPPDHPPGQDVFNVSVYQRGALTLAALRAEVGDDAFFEFLRSYVAAFSGRTVTTESFLAFTQVVLGPDAVDLVTEWLREPALPDLPD